MKDNILKEELEELSIKDLIKLVLFYRKECISCGEILKDYAQNNLSSQALHKVISARKYSRIDLIKDYKIALKEDI